MAIPIINKCHSNCASHHRRLEAADNRVLHPRIMNQMGGNVAVLLGSVVNSFKIASQDVLLTGKGTNIVVTLKLGDFVHLTCNAHTIKLAFCQTDYVTNTWFRRTTITFVYNKV